ncbi:tRNA (Uracil-5-) -methyltransferase [Renibacterium salmoninarum ATCC 33209]|uniref:tRNA (Uracil-5-)-methyltransferase n=1 Tax=Renibacterium salmoninarum (strain ATCC 33209 / DSM 20767 / JCM 11484 / NBRC 15589 / NCIMB 2235) TaxID=288705 RepID=A9WRB4_RENSM|nr:class I SAM-dependent RNA methyltransferase [Renibacterium salmoninarum]ABY24123.1 tRNA (Uracil-5-) -methyltransferase [Renibacterium salmoninarum ATCC 33209]
MTELILDVGPVAHGGHFVARQQGRVIFVRHALPGERVRVSLTEAEEDASFWRADVIEVLEESAQYPGARLPHFWAAADSLQAHADGRLPIGGAEFGHISRPVQRELKSAVLAEQLQRLAGIDLAPLVEEVSGEDPAGLGWRTRTGFTVTDEGALGMHAHRSHQVLPVQEMPLAVRGIRGLDLWGLDFTGVERVEIAAPTSGDGPLLLLSGAKQAAARVAKQLPEGVFTLHWEPKTSRVSALRGRGWLEETVADKRFRVSGDGFWQIHRNAPKVLSEAVGDYLGDDLLPGAAAADLYAGAGLFTALLADAVGSTGWVLSVEGSPVTSKDAKLNFAGRAEVQILPGRVERVLATAARESSRKLDVVVLDPPRAGAGKAVVGRITASGAKAVAYVSCDPASFARDLGYFFRAGWELTQLRAFDLYPHTHHLETVALLRPKP